jgi:gamma-glutamylcysteine synthetase
VGGHACRRNQARAGEGYRHWLATLERLVAEKGVASPATLRRYHDAWDHAADRTPHGSPIELRPEDFS